jgi:lipopolysaccharide biosynthesis glycosyltransferase
MVVKCIQRQFESVIMESTNRLKAEDVQGNVPIVIVCAADDRYAMPLAVMMRSAIENLDVQRNVFLYIIDGGISIENKDKIIKSLPSERCEIVFLTPPNILMRELELAHQYCVEEKIQSSNHVSLAAYYRLLIAELLPQDCEKAIYLDCDLIIKGDLERIWQIDIEENYALAVQDIWIHSVSLPEGLLNYKELGFDADDKYFNSGVMVINIKKWRVEKFFLKAVDYFRENKHYVRYHDQDILNALFAGKWGEIDTRWNTTLMIYYYDGWEESPFSEEIYNNLIQDPWIIHFATDLKPWNSCKTRLKENFFHYVDMTAWSGWRFTLRRQFQRKISRGFQKLKQLTL